MEGVVLALGVCLVLALITKRFTLPAIPFYIIGGLLIGETGLKLVEASPVSDFLTELGLLFLLFFMGLEIKPSRIWSNKSSILTSGVLDLAFNVAVGFIAAFALGFPLAEASIIAAAFFISSTAMAVTSLIENHKLLMPEAETIVWLMVFEDIVLIIILSVIGASPGHPALVVGKMAAVILIIWAIGRYGRKQLTQALARDDELPALLTFTIVIIVAYFSEGIGIPATFMVIAAGVMLGSVNAPSFERHARPFKDVFLVVFFVFFGITVQFAGEASLAAIVVICIAAVASKFISGIVIGRVVHGKAVSGIEIWTNTIGRGEFSIAIAALYGSAIVSGVIAVMVIVTSILGAFAAQYSGNIRGIMKRPARNLPAPVPEHE